MSSRLLFSVSAVLVLLILEPASLSARGNREESSPPATEKAYPEYLSLADGLHVTGTPIEVDAPTYRLTINGSVLEPQALSLDQVRALPSERLRMVLECPGFFTDTGYWTGVRLRDLLAIAKLKSDAKTVEFSSIDGSYSQSLTLAEIMEGNVLVAYQFDDRDFPVYHGYPLRIAAEGMPGSVWVKWLGTITVR